MSRVYFLLETVRGEDLGNLNFLFIGSSELIVPLPVAVVQDVSVRVSIESFGWTLNYI